MAPRFTQEIPPSDLFVIAGSMPPGLNTTMPQDQIKFDETPDCYGLDLTKDGRITKGTAPTGTSRIQKAVTLSSVPYFWHYNRLWNITNKTAATASNILTYGAALYDDIYVPQRNGKMFFNEDTETITAIVPFAPDSMFVAKTSGSYVVTNLSGSYGVFQKSDIMQDMRLSTAANIIQVDNTVYVSNDRGLWAYDNGKVKELSRKIRNTLYGMTNMALTANYERKWIIGTSGSVVMVYDAVADKLFKYDGSSFLYTTRQYHAPDYSPISVNRVFFLIEHADTNPGSLSYQVKFEDDAWPASSVIKNLPATDERYTIVTEDLAEARSTIRFQMRLTNITSNKYIKEIRVDSNIFRADAYRT